LQLAEQLKLEEERNAILLEQLRKEEEERRQKMIDEKEQRDREERERLEEEQRQREEEIERKSKLELDRIQKEQEKQEMLLEEERIERKKRVEMIMARVSSKRINISEEESPTLTNPIESSAASPPEQLSDPARLKVNDFLRSRGFGRSTEDVSTPIDKHEESGTKSDRDSLAGTGIDFNGDKQIETSNDCSITDGSNDGLENKLISSVIINTPSIDDTITIALKDCDSGKGACEMNIGDDLSDANSLQKYLTYNNSSLTTNISKCNDSDPSKSISISSCINNELSGTADEISLAVNKCVEQVNNDHPISNDTNNNKDFVIENKSEPNIVWDENEAITRHESHEKIQMPGIEGGNGSMKSTQGNDNISFYVNDNQDVNIIGSGVRGVTSDSFFMQKSGDFSHEMEQDQWDKFDARIRQIQPPVDQVAGNDENKLWKVLEGKVELSECF